MKMMAVSAIAQSGAVMSDILEASDWLYSFFSNISYHLESSRWGNRFPVLLCEFCDLGVVEYDHLDKLERELDAAYSGLARIPVEDAIYDIKNPAAPIPWEILPEAENAGIRLCEPWLTARTDDSFFDVFRKKYFLPKHSIHDCSCMPLCWRMCTRLIRPRRSRARTPIGKCRISKPLQKL